MNALALLPLLALASCVAQPSPTKRPSSTPTNTSSGEPLVQEPLSEKPEKDSSPVAGPRLIRTTLEGVKIEAVTFDSRSHHLVVADQPDGPGSLWPDSQSAAKANGGLAALNAGFFTPEGKPLGKLIASGRSRGNNNTASSLGAGYFTETSSGQLQILRRQKFKGGRQALQTGPFLIEEGRSIPGLSSKSSSARCFIATDGKSKWLLARTGACSLAELSQALTGASIGGTKVETALNLDGGRSSDLWVSGMVGGGPLETRPFWNKPVRNFLVLRTRD